VCEGGTEKTEEPCAYYFTNYACSLGFSEAVHYVVPTLACTTGSGATKPSSNGLAQI